MKYAAFLVLGGLFLILPSCDIIEDPDGPPAPNVPFCTDTPSFQPRVNPEIKLLLEDYTGHRCGNCPLAASKLHELQVAHPGQVVGLAVHAQAAGYFTAPKTGTAFTHDFRNEVSNTLDAFFQVAATGLPKGVVNRKRVNGAYDLPISTWGQIVQQELNASQMADLQVKTLWDSSTSSLCAFVFIEHLSGTLPDSLMLSVYLAENSFVNWQADYSVPGEEIEFYEHNHVLRASLGPIWGKAVQLNGTSAVLSFSKSFSGATWVMSNCSVVAVLQNGLSREVIQAEEVAAIP
ncbi:MAG: Omp28-related outer membrane protein [Bacteroidetes bacterium]|nr:Omp28-related outer membrane protein [Bacteroidota bacterium]